MSGKYLGPADRQVIAQEWAAYSSVAAIADKVGVAKKLFMRNCGEARTASWITTSALPMTRNWPSAVSRKTSDAGAS